jgi:hypothetical protein
MGRIIPFLSPSLPEMSVSGMAANMPAPLEAARAPSALAGAQPIPLR